MCATEIGKKNHMVVGNYLWESSELLLTTFDLYNNMPEAFSGVL